MASEMMVTYSVKELLERLETKIDDMRDEFGSRLTTLETDKATRDNKKEARKWFIPLLSSSVLGVMAVLATLLVVII